MTQHRAFAKIFPLENNPLYGIYHHLRILLEEKDITRLNILLQQFLSFLHKDQSIFLAYFQNEYVPHIEEWAYAYRYGAEINTNMYVEIFTVY